MSNWYAEPDSGTSASRSFRWRSLFSWGLFLGLGLLVWELTDQTGLAVSVACLRFGLDESATGAWLLWRDPVRNRGWACFTFHFARGSGRSGVIAVCVTTLAEVLQRWGAGPNQRLIMNQNFMMHTLLLGLCCIAIWTFASGVGVVIAVTGKLRLWIDPTTRRSRKYGAWPPDPIGKNRIRPSAMIGVLQLSQFFCTPLIVMTSPWLLWGLLPLAAWLGWKAANRIAASSPSECWPELDAVDVDPDEVQIVDPGWRLVDPRDIPR